MYFYTIKHCSFHSVLNVLQIIRKINSRYIFKELKNIKILVFVINRSL